MDRILLLDDSVDLRRCSMANPLTALCIKYIMLDKGLKSFIFLGANSALGRMLIRAALRKGFMPIAMVRNEEEAKSLKSEFKELENILLMNDEYSLDKLSGLISNYQTSFLIDTVGGDQSGRIFERMPANSEMVFLGNLSKDEYLKFNATEFFLHNKKLRGFNLEEYMKEELSEMRRIEFFKILAEDFKSGGKYFGDNNIVKEFKLEQWQTALSSSS